MAQCVSRCTLVCPRSSLFSNNNHLHLFYDTRDMINLAARGCYSWVPCRRLCSGTRLNSKHSLCVYAVQPGRLKEEQVAAASSASDGGGGLNHGKSGERPATIPLTSGRAMAVGYLQGLIDAEGRVSQGMTQGVSQGGRDKREVTSALHDELAYLLMEGLLVSSLTCFLWWLQRHFGDSRGAINRTGRGGGWTYIFQRGSWTVGEASAGVIGGFY